MLLCHWLGSNNFCSLDLFRNIVPDDHEMLFRKCWPYCSCNKNRNRRNSLLRRRGEKVGAASLAEKTRWKKKFKNREGTLMLKRKRKLQRYVDRMLSEEDQELMRSMDDVFAVMTNFERRMGGERRESNHVLWPKCGKARKTRLIAVLSEHLLVDSLAELVCEFTRHPFACNHSDNKCTLCGLRCENEDCAKILYCIRKPHGHLWCSFECSFESLQNQGLLDA
jgi:hypothetical protein